MKREVLERDFRTVDDIVICSGEAAQHSEDITLNMLYWLAVAVWHILDWILKKEKNNG